MFKPYNRHLHVETFEPDVPSSETTVLLPESFKLAKDIEVVRVLSKSDDCDLEIFAGEIAIVEGHMIKSLDLDGETVQIVLENYVLGTYNPTQGK